MIKRLVLLLVLSTPAFGQWTEIQKAWNSTAGASPATTTVSLPSVALGNVVTVSVVYLGTATGFTMAVTDGNGHGFTASPSSPCVYTTGQKVWLFYLVNTPAATMTVTATPSVAHGVSVHAVEFHPPAGNVLFDADACAVPTSGTTPVNTPSLTPVKSGVLYAAVIPDPSVGTGQISVIGGSWTLGTSGVIASDNNDSADAYQFSATTLTSVNWTVTSSGNTGWDAMIASLVVTPGPNLIIRGKVILKGTTIVK